jgi:hypothetical protein
MPTNYNRRLSPADIAAIRDPGSLPRSARPTRTVRNRADKRKGLRGEALIIINSPHAYGLFDDSDMNRDPDAIPLAVYSVLFCLLAVWGDATAVMRNLADDRGLFTAMLRNLEQHVGADAAILMRRRNEWPARSTWVRMATDLAAAQNENPEVVRERFRVTALTLALEMGHLDPERRRTRLSSPDRRDFLAIDGTVIKGPTDNRHPIVQDADGTPRAKRIDTAVRAHYEAGDAPDGEDSDTDDVVAHGEPPPSASHAPARATGTRVAGSKFVFVHTRGPGWRDSITLDLAHDSEPRSGVTPGTPGARSEVRLAIDMVDRLRHRDAVPTLYGDIAPFVSGVAYDKALRGGHADALAAMDLIAASLIIPETAARDGQPAIYRELDLPGVLCTNLPHNPNGDPADPATGHYHRLFARQGVVWTIRDTDAGSVYEIPSQRVDYRAPGPRGGRARWYRRITIKCALGEGRDHQRTVSILGDNSAAQTDDAGDDTLVRGEYLRVFSELEDTFKTVYVNRPAAENKNSELDASMLWKRIPAWGVFKQTLHLVGYYTGINILNHHYVTESEDEGDATDDDEESFSVHQSGVSVTRLRHRCALEPANQTTRLHHRSHRY